MKYQPDAKYQLNPIAGQLIQNGINPVRSAEQLKSSMLVRTKLVEVIGF